MSDVPRDLSEEAVAGWLFDASQEADPGETWDDIVKDDEGTRDIVLRVARAVLALVREKAREAVRITEESVLRESGLFQEEIVARVMGDHPSDASGGHGEPSGRDEAPRG